MNRILLLEDDAGLTDGLCYSLHKNGFEVAAARTVAEADRLLREDAGYDLLMLDVALPDGTGYDVCERVRKRDRRIPILFLTAADEEVNIIRGLDCGGDDYITKPFKLGELCSRIRALLRRAGTESVGGPSVIHSGDITIDLIGSRALLGGVPLELTVTEYRLLCLFVQNEGQILSRDVILGRLWDGAGDFVDDNTLSVYVRRLREKIERDPFRPERLTTVRGFGYRWRGVTV